MTDFFATQRTSPSQFSYALANLYSMYSFEALSSCQNLLSSHDVKRFLNRCGDNPEGIFGAIFLQATFPGIAGIYYGDEIGLSGADDPFNREPYPWDSEETWNTDIFSYTTNLMKLKNENPILKYGRFELIESNDEIVMFRRTLKDESLLCIINRDKNTKSLKIKTTAHSVEVAFGDRTVHLSDGNIQIDNIVNVGTIISEK